MQKHVSNYLQHYGYDTATVILCQVCGQKAVDIHHIVPRSKFGTKTKHLQDAVTNLVALCRHHHEQAHANRAFNESLKQLAAQP